jgi:hypothetical protein
MAKSKKQAKPVAEVTGEPLSNKEYAKQLKYLHVELVKLSPMDLKSYDRWDDYTKARDEMFAATDSDWAPWFVARSEDKKRVRLIVINHLLPSATPRIAWPASTTMRSPCSSASRPPNRRTHAAQGSPPA